jgi:predicted helicase
MEELAQTSLPGMASLSEESHLAAKVKKERPILVILGNPPYSGHSANKGDWIKDQIETYKRIDGKPLGEKNPKWLQDDYVKFIRFAQWKIDQIGEGVLGFITNHSYLDNPTFRGMRQSLMNSFDEIYILDLHGNSLKKEKAPDGSKDENVFDIQQGVAIALFVKRKQRARSKIVMHGEIWGVRERKYEWLTKHELKKTNWSELKPVSPFYLFIPRDERLNKRFQSYPSIPTIFPMNSVGIVTARDHLTIHWTSQQVWTTVLNFVSLDPEIARQAYQLGNDVRDWKVKLAQEDLKKSGPAKGNIVPILYRPFDIRFTYYTGKSKGFHCMPRGEVMRHMLQPNLAIILPRRVETAIPWSHVFLSSHLVEHVAVSLKTIDYCYPLYSYENTDRHDLFSQNESGERVPNLAPKLVEALKLAFKKDPSPEQIFHYIYALLYSNAYRKKYAEFLKTDFPRVPFTKDYKLFSKLAEKGEELVDLHLLKSKKLIKPVAKCEGSGDLRVDKVTYDQNKARVLINPEKWFAGIPPEVWEYHIGGYQVSEKWLKDRKGKGLSSEEVAHYARVVTAIAETISIQGFLDDLFAEVETSLLEVTL